MSRVVTVAVPVPGLGLLSYDVPDTLPLPVPPVGSRVLVPLGSRVVTGCVVSTTDPPTLVGLKPLVDVLDSEPMLTAEVVDLALWVAEYYACAPGEAVAAAMPPRAWVTSERRARITEAGQAALEGHPSDARRRLLEVLSDGALHPVGRVGRVLASASGRSASAARGLYALLASMARDGLVEVTQSLKGSASAFKSIGVATLTPEGRALRDQGRSLGARQREALDQLAGARDGMPVPALRRLGISGDTVRRLVERGAVTVGRTVVERDPCRPRHSMRAACRPAATVC